ncbi:MAG: hypothetical protein KAT70_08315 [Thermoplasmata archaeon]|nr:hypothetical protein [Thermoplasmata archaeon]
MKRLRYPSGEYLFRSTDMAEVGERISSIIENNGHTIIKTDHENEGEGTLFIAVNKTRKEMKKKEHLSHMIPFLGPLLEDAFHIGEAYDIESNRVGIEAYLWPVEDGVLLELFVLPYMEHLDRPEIFKLTESKSEEVADWYLCNLVWDELSPAIKKGGADRIQRYL